MKSGSARAAFAGSLRLVFRNPAIIVPGLVIGALAALVSAVLQPAQPLDSNVFSRLLQGVVQLIASILSIAYTTGMADAAWRDGRARFSDGARAFRRDAGHVLVAMLLLLAIGFVAAVAAPYTLGLSLFVYMFFCIYTMAAAVAGERPGVLALRESIDIAFARPLTTLLVVGGIVAIAFAMGLLAEVLGRTPLVGPLVSGVVVQIVIAYATLVVVGEYRAVSVAKGAA
jgi:hypothetical protein